MKRFALSLVVGVFLTMPVVAGEIDGGGKQPPPPPPPASTLTSAIPTEIVIEAILLLTSIWP